MKFLSFIFFLAYSISSFGAFDKQALSTTTFIGPTANSALPAVVTNYQQYQAQYGGDRTSSSEHLLNLSVHFFFLNGGKKLYIQPLAHADYEEALDQVFLNAPAGLVALPLLSREGHVLQSEVHALIQARLVSFGTGKVIMPLFFVLDAPEDASVAQMLTIAGRIDSKFMALFASSVQVSFNGQQRLLPVSSLVTGRMAWLEDNDRITKSIGNQLLNGALDVHKSFSNSELESLVATGINPIRSFSGRGVRVWGARTLSKNKEFRYISVARLQQLIGYSIEKGSSWVQGRMNDQNLWSDLQFGINNFMNMLFRQGHFAGATVREAFAVRCNSQTTTYADILAGRVNCAVFFAPLRPAEYTYQKITLKLN